MPDLDRRSLLRAGLVVAGSGVLSACGLTGAPELVDPDSTRVRAADQRRDRTGRTRAFTYAAVAAPVDLGGVTAQTWSYDGVLPGKELRATVGDQLEVTETNRTPQPTTVHWHGLALRNDADGVPDVTQEPIAPGRSFTYRFVTDPRAPTGSARTSAPSSTAACTRRWSSKTRGSRSATTTNGLSSSTTGSTASRAPRRRARRPPPRRARHGRRPHEPRDGRDQPAARRRRR